MFRAPDFAKVRSATRATVGDRSRFTLSRRSTEDGALFPDKDEARLSLDADARRIDELQDALYASQGGALLVVLQGIDTSGKDGVTKSVFRYTGPLGVRVHPFGRPSEMELAHDFLWRVHQAAPRRGHIAVFNRSHYEDVLVVRVRKLAPPERVDERYDQINEFEKHLVANGTRVLKLMLHVSKEEQGVRLRERLEKPEKRWKFNPDDLADRRLWDDYQRAYEIMLRRCSTPHAPWFVVPSDSKSRRDAIAARLVLAELEDMAPRYPDPGYRPEQFKID